MRAPHRIYIWMAIIPNARVFTGERKDLAWVAIIQEIKPIR